MNREAAFTVADNMLSGSAKPFKVICDGHDSYSIEVKDKQLAVDTKKFLDDQGFMDYKIDLLQRPFFYLLH